MRPSKRKPTRSQTSSASAMLWVVRKIVLPRALRLLMRSRVARARAGSCPVVGSSRNSRSGSCSRARARLSRIFMPFENWSTR